MNKSTRIAMDITAGYQYVYDPYHNSKPNGMWKRTNSGWSTNDGEGVGMSHVKQPKPQPRQEVAPSSSESHESTTQVSHAGTKAPKQQPVSPSRKQPAVEENDPAEKKPEETMENLIDEQPVDHGDEGENDDFTLDEGEESNDDNLFDEDGADDDFTLDEEGKQEEEKAIDENAKENPSEEGSEQTEDVDDGLFDDANKDKYVDPDQYDQYIEQMNTFIQQFDESEGKENDITFKAIASNLDWDSLAEVKAFAEHCAKKGLEGANEILAFLYFQHQEDGEKFDKLIADMK